MVSFSFQMEGREREHPDYCFQQWMNLQQEDLGKLVEASQRDSENESLCQLVEKALAHFQDYMDKRSYLARQDVSIFYAPPWCTTIENSLLWIAGCRPSSFIRLVYALCGSQLEAQLNESLQGERKGNLGDLSACQLARVDALQTKTIREEDRLSGQIASYQEDIADQPLAVIAKGLDRIGEPNQEAEQVLDQHERAMAGMLEEADKLRLNTLKELLEILTPVQAVDFLAASKKLHLSIHEWGKRRDHSHGRN